MVRVFVFYPIWNDSFCCLSLLVRALHKCPNQQRGRIGRNTESHQLFRTLGYSSSNAMKERSTPISVIVADDHPVVLRGIAEILQAASDLKVTAVCNGGAAAIEAVRKAKPNIAVLDMSMPAVDGLQVLSNIAANGYSTKVIFLTATASDDQILDAIAGGAKGVCLRKPPQVN